MAVTAKAEMKSMFKSCVLCPRECGIDRSERTGYCGERDALRISRAALHMWEEPCISGKNGSGTVFFVGCPLRCSFCQNHDIATSTYGGEITVERLADIFFELKDKGAHNINLVTPTHFLPHIIDAIDIAKGCGFDLPFVYNCGGYEKADMISRLSGYIDIFLPDFKYFYPETAMRYSNAQSYPQRAMEAIDEMVQIAGKPKFDDDGMMMRGVIVRHLVLPSHADESIEILKYLNNTYKNDIYISIMNQYTPMKSEFHKELQRKLTTYEYQKVLAAAEKIGIVNGFIQMGGTQSESFIPSFDMTGVYSPDK